MDGAQAKKKALFDAKLNAQKKEKRINSSLIRYNEFDQPVCRVCEVVLKSESQWDAHQASRKHHQAISNIKAGATGVTQASNASSKTQHHLESQNAELKPSKKVAEAQPQNHLPKAQPSSVLPSDFFDNHEAKKPKTDSVKMVDPNSSRNTGGSTKTQATMSLYPEKKMDGLPISNATQTMKVQSARELTEKSTQMADSESKPPKGVLPEGFFDNKDADLRAHGINPVKPDVNSKMRRVTRSRGRGKRHIDEVSDELLNPTLTASSSTLGLDIAVVENMIQTAIRADLGNQNATQPQQTQGAGPSSFTPITLQGQIGLIFNLPSKHQPPEFSGTTDPFIAEEWIKIVERTMALFTMTDQEKIRYATYILRGDARIWWELMEQIHNIATLSWIGFKKLFDKEYRSADMMFVKMEEFLSLQQGSKTVKEYSTLFNSLARFAPIMVSTPQIRMDRFVNGLHPEIARDVMVDAQPPQTYDEALNRALRAEDYVNRARQPTQSLALPNNPPPITQKSGYEVISGVKNGNKSKKNFQPMIITQNMKNKQQQERRNIPNCQTCGNRHFGECLRGSNGNRHFGECLRGSNVCYKCRQPGHKARDCRTVTTPQVQTVRGGGSARMYTVVQSQSESSLVVNTEMSIRNLRS